MAPEIETLVHGKNDELPALVRKVHPDPRRRSRRAEPVSGTPNRSFRFRNSRNSSRRPTSGTMKPSPVDACVLGEQDEARRAQPIDDLDHLVHRQPDAHRDVLDALRHEDRGARRARCAPASSICSSAMCRRHCTTRWFGVGSSSSSTCWFALSSRVASALMMRSAISGRARSIASNVLPSITSRRDVDAHDRGRRARPRVEDRHLAEELARRQHREHALGLADLAADLDLARAARRTCNRRAAPPRTAPCPPRSRGRTVRARRSRHHPRSSSHGRVAQDVEQRAAADLGVAMRVAPAARPRRTSDRASPRARASRRPSRRRDRSCRARPAPGTCSARTGPTPDQRWR